MIQLDAKIPDGPIEDKWHNHLEHAKLVGPRNRPTYDVIVVGTGLAGASAASSMAAMGYKVDSFCFQPTVLGPSFLSNIHTSQRFKSTDDRRHHWCW